MTYQQFTTETGEQYGGYEVFYYHDSVGIDATRLGPAGWYWHACLPGCMPDGDLSGPFQSEAEAIADADPYRTES